MEAHEPRSHGFDQDQRVMRENENINIYNQSISCPVASSQVHQESPSNSVSRDDESQSQQQSIYCPSSAMPAESSDQIMEKHPTRDMSRQETTDVQRQNINVRAELGDDVENYLRIREQEFDTRDCLQRHEVTAPVRARMIDWVIEVLTNFYCDDQTFFIAISLMDRYLKHCPHPQKISSLHILGVTSMFIASKFEDINPLRMKTVDEKISQKKIPIDQIKQKELDILRVVKYQIHAPTILDFLKYFLAEVLGIHVQNRAETRRKQEFALKHNQAKKEKAAGAESTRSRQHVRSNRFDHVELNEDKLDDDAKVENYLIEKMAIYLAKMCMHDIELSARRPSLLAVGSIYVALKISEQLKKKDLINSAVVCRLLKKSKMKEDDILDVSQKVLYLAQNFDKELPGLDNLKNTHFKLITQLL